MTLILPMISPPVQYSVTAMQFLNRLNSDPGATRKAAYAALIDGLVANGIWSKLDVLYILAANMQNNALINLINANYTCSLSGSPTFTANSGYSGTSGNSDFVSSPYNYSINGVNFTQNSAHLGAWVASGIDGVQTCIAPYSNPGGTDENLYPSFSGSLYIRVNDSGAGSGGFSVASPVGFSVGNRSSSTDRQIYKNGVSIGTPTQTSKSPINDMLAMARSSYVVTSLVSVGGSLSSTDVSNFYSVLNKYKWW